MSLKIISHQECEALDSGTTLKSDTQGNPIVNILTTTDDGRYAIREIYPMRQDMRGVALGFFLNGDSQEVHDFYKQLLLSKLSPYLNQLIESKFSENGELIIEYVRVNLDWICENSLEDKDRNIYISRGSEEFDWRRKKEVNNQIFTKRIQDKIYALASNKYGVFEDYIACRRVQNNQELFLEFQEKYKNMLWVFAHKKHRSFFVEPDDMFQELSMVLWKCVGKYTGKNFARFSTFLRKAIKNRISDMYDARHADKRIVTMYTDTYGSISDTDSFLAAKIDREVFAFWNLLDPRVSHLIDISSNDLSTIFTNRTKFILAQPRKRTHEDDQYNIDDEVIF